ncbi:MAG TPA: hypothetical protein DCM05_13640 [Elusimicrobia bacterium]|nr:hypothetical protein [Elusimicrobiota bacterium]
MSPLFYVVGLMGAGFVFGTFGTLLGLGGGVFAVPALVLWFDVPMHSAVAASLVAVIATSSAGASRNVAEGLANIRLGVCLEPMTVFGALLGGALAPFIPARVLIGIFAILLAAIGVMLWRGQGLKEEGSYRASGGRLDGRFLDPLSGEKVAYSVERLPATLAVSFAAGLSSALLGLGGGLLKVPALHLLSRVPIKAAAATSNFMIGVTAAASAVLYLGRGEIPLVVAGTMTLGVLLGSQAGHALSRKLSERSVSRVFSLVTLALAFEMARRALAS